MSMVLSESHELTNVLLKHIDEPCPQCGYRIKKPPSNQCPECGYTLVPTLRPPILISPKYNVWMLFLLGVSVTIGIVIDRTGFFFNAMVFQGNPIRWMALLPNIAILLFLVGVLSLCCRWRQSMEGLPRRVNVYLVITATTLPLICWVVLFYTPQLL